MKRTGFFPAVVLGFLAFASCNNATKPAANTTDSISPVRDKTVATAPAAPTTPVAENYCFLRAWHKDSTFVNLTIDTSGVKGTMHWQPYEKDGAVGTLSGKKNAAGEMELLFDYVIEGSHQTETKIMKLENDKLMIKEGELADPKNDGHLKYKNASKAVYKDTLNKVACK